jgi:hypothetical protein
MGCAPALPTSASPAGGHRQASRSGSTIEKQRMAGSVLTACLTRGDNPRMSSMLPVCSVRCNISLIAVRAELTWMRPSGVAVTGHSDWSALVIRPLFQKCPALLLSFRATKYLHYL